MAQFMSVKLMMGESFKICINNGHAAIQVMWLAGDYETNIIRNLINVVLVDIWDGANDEPVIYHGYTLTSKILVKDVLQAVHDYAFIKSPYVTFWYFITALYLYIYFI